MSAPHPVNGAHPADDDGVDIQKILAVGVVSLVIFAISALIAWLILRADVRKIDAVEGRPPVPSQIGKDEIGIVDQVEFNQDNRLDEWRAAKRKRLGSYGWVDRDKGLVHIPIDKAMEQVVSQAAGTP
jgi:hypothetical protein